MPFTLVRTLLPIGVLLVAAGPLPAQSAPAPESRPPAFTALKAEYDQALARFRKEREKERAAEAAAQAQKSAEAKKAAEKALAEAKTDEERAEAKKNIEAARAVPAMKMFGPADGPAPEFAPRFLALARQHPGEPDSVDSLAIALTISGSRGGVWEQAVAELRARYVEAPGIKRVFRVLMTGIDEGGPDFLRQVIAKNPDRKLQAHACKALADGLEEARDRAEAIQKQPAVRSRLEAEFGKEAVERFLSRAGAVTPEVAALRTTLSERYSDVLPDLSVGKPAPEVQTTTGDGRPARLSDLRGKVVVLDIWTTWCGPCKAMIPHERAMAERFKDTPFALVSISGDEKRETLVKFLEKEPMPWTHWWNGKEGGIIEDWDVRYFPTIYVLDAKGVIRHKDIRGEKLENAVRTLLAEMGVPVPETRPDTRPH